MNQDGVVRQGCLYSVPSFDAAVSKLVFSFWCCLRKSDNMLIQAVLSSDIYQSSLFQTLCNILFQTFIVVGFVFMFLSV